MSALRAGDHGSPNRLDRRLRARLRNGPLSHQVIALADDLVGILVHLKGLAESFQSLIQAWSAVVSVAREQNAPRSRHCRCGSANQRST